MLHRRLGSHRSKRALTLGVVLLGTSLWMTAIAWGADLYVNPDGLCGGNSPCYTTIQAAITAASPSGDVIHVAAGTYSENLSISKNVTLLGAQAGVDARGRVVGVPNPLVESVLKAPSGTIVTLLTGSAGTVIDGFAFDGASVASRGIESTSGPIDNLRLLNGHYSRLTGTLVFLNDNGIDIDVIQNEFNGAVGTGTIFHLDQDTFHGMHIIDNRFINRTSATGLFCDGTRNLGLSTRAPLISGNLFNGNGTGANLGRMAFDAGSITNNTFSNSGFDGLQGGPRTTAITGNVFSNNGRSGLALTGFGGGTNPIRGAQGCTISGNTFTGNVQEGLFFSSSQFAGTISSNIANNNDFLGTGMGAYYAGSETINVGCNWWNDIGGPNYPPANLNALGAGLFGTNMSFSPWLNGSITGSPLCNQTPDRVFAVGTGLCISTPTPCVNVPFQFNRANATTARGISVTFQIDTSKLMLCSTPVASIHQGTWLSGYSTNFQVLDNGGGSYTVDQAILGLPCGVTTGGQVFTVDLKASDGDGTGTVTVTNVIVRDCDNAPLPWWPGCSCDHHHRRHRTDADRQPGRRPGQDWQRRRRHDQDPAHVHRSG